MSSVRSTSFSSKSCGFHATDLPWRWLTQVAEVVTFTLVSEPITGLSGKRYGEVLLVTPGEAGLQAAVYNSFGLNDCPAEFLSWPADHQELRGHRHGIASANPAVRDEPGALHRKPGPPAHGLHLRRRRRG